MTSEADFLASLRALATHPAARGLMDDAAVFPFPAATNLVLTHDMLVEGVHFLPGDPPEDVAWKLLAVNLSDLAAKGAAPIGVLMGYGLGGDAAWDNAFVAGLGQALVHFAVPLLGGDTVAMPKGAPRALGLTAIGAADEAPARSGAQPGDRLWVTGTIGDAGLGLRVARGETKGAPGLLEAYRRPMPRLAAGRTLAPYVHAMCDVSDGLLLDARRIAVASGLGLFIDLDAVPLSEEARALGREDRSARLAAATAGDDYELLFAAPDAEESNLLTLCKPLGLRLTAVGRFAQAPGFTLRDAGGEVPLPAALGYEHETHSDAPQG